MVLDDGKTAAAMVACDLIGLSRPVVAAARRIIQQQTGIPIDHIVISATHTHTAPVVVGDSALDDMTSGGSQLNKDYANQLPRWIAQAVPRGVWATDAGPRFLRQRRRVENVFHPALLDEGRHGGLEPGRAESEYSSTDWRHRPASERGLRRDGGEEAAVDLRQFRRSLGYDRRHVPIRRFSRNACPTSGRATRERRC